jgi:hypothetical protein
MRNVARSFVKDGTRYFVLTKSYAGWRTRSEGARAAYDGQEEWQHLKERILSHWRPNAAFTTFSKRAHVAAKSPPLAGISVIAGGKISRRRTGWLATQC